MPCEVDDWFSNNLHGYIMPGHSGLLAFIKVAYPVLSYVGKVFSSGIRVVNSRPPFVGFGFLMCEIEQFVFVRVHSAVAEVKASKEAYSLVDDNHFFVVRPEDRDNLTWVTLYTNIWGHFF